METTTSKPAIIEKPVWFITGCSTGFGRELAKHVLVEPNGLRTDWAGRSANESKRQIDDYAATAGVRRSQSRSTSGKQPGDPVRGAHAIVKAVEPSNPPHHLLLGNAAHELALAKLEDLRKEFSAWEAVSRGADFPRETQGQAA